jgi:hypothetical protein
MAESNFQEIVWLDGFRRDMKALSKRFRSLPEDLQTFANAALMLYHKVGGAYAEAQGIHQISGLGFTNPNVYKATKFACKSLKGKGSRSGIRLTYAYFEDLDRIELIEIYFKGDKENEDRKRIKTLYGRKDVPR